MKYVRSSKVVDYIYHLLGRFSLRGSELGWAKSWLLHLGLGEENSIKLKLRMGLNLKSYKAYAKLRFRAEPFSPMDIGDGLTCAGKLPVPVYVLPMLKSIPLRVEYRLRLHTASQVLYTPLSSCPLYYVL